MLDPDFPLNGTEIAFCAALIAIAVYVITSLVTCRVPHDMDRLLHRGKYAVEPEGAVAEPAAQRFSVRKIIGIDEGFTRGDRCVAYGVFWWSIGWFLIVLTGTILEFFQPFSDETWAFYWKWAALRLPLTVAAITGIWFCLGAARDLVAFFRHMHSKRIDIRDDGTVDESH